MEINVKFIQGIVRKLQTKLVSILRNHAKLLKLENIKLKRDVVLGLNTAKVINVKTIIKNANM